MVNNVILKGNLTQPPYFDYVGDTGRAFMRLYLAMSQPNGMALTILKGNLTQPPYFDYVGDENHPFMRLYLAVNRPPGSRRKTGERGEKQDADFLRVVAYDDAALFSYPYLRPGSQVLVSGNLRARKRRLPKGTQTVVEVVASDITFLRKIDWEAGDAERDRIRAERAAALEQGTLPEPIRPANTQGGGYFRVVSYDNLARLSYPYLQKGSEVLVLGRLRARKRQLSNGKRETVIEIVARNIVFLRKIDWETGNAERDRILADRANQG